MKYQEKLNECIRELPDYPVDELKDLAEEANNWDGATKKQALLLTGIEEGLKIALRIAEQQRLTRKHKPPLRAKSKG